MSDLLSQLEQLSGSTSRVVATQPPPTAAPETDLPAQLSPELLRVQARSIDELTRSTSDLLIDTTGGGGLSRFEEYVSRLEETATEWARLRRAALASVRTLGDNPDFRPAAACLTFVDTHLTSLRRDARRLSENLSQSVRSTKSKTDVVYQAACRIRMTPAESVFSSFGPMVRDLARQEGREVLFETAGLDINADLLVLQGLKDPVMHLLRNAVSHGIEPPEERARMGKAKEGTIRLLLRTRGDRLELIVEDDGRGIDYGAVEREARTRGMVAADEQLEDEADVKSLILRAGFSTSKTVSGVSGRGMGLAIVETAVRRPGWWNRAEVQAGRRHPGDYLGTAFHFEPACSAGFDW